ncbi:MAG: helix-turn-helix domain-containing protein [Rhodospirillales bacterium]|nr:helix-turn-helix domain-containing protein [Rhodospirillales bacterium]
MCRALRDKGVPFLFLSAGGNQHPLTPREFRAAPHLAMPFEPSQLKSVLQTLIGAPTVAPDGTTFGNAILDMLGPAERCVLAPSLERVALRTGERLEPPGQPTAYVYFPVEGLISMFTGATAGTRIEIATVGSDGMIGQGVLLGDLTAGEALVQAAGSAWRIASGTLQRLAELHPALRHHLLAHIGLALRQVMDAASYGGRATIVERLARWLVQAAHRLNSRRLAITHDSLAEILGVRRPSVTTALQALEGRHLIHSTRRAIVVLDPRGLAARR